MRRRRSNRSRAGESGYLLLAVMLVMTLILIAMSVEAPRIAQQIKREKEDELVHRGKDFAYAVKRFAHKNGGRYPVSIEQLEDTNHVRFLRKRYKDPMTGDSDWKLIHYGEAQITIPTTNSTNPGLNPSTQNPGLGGGTPSTPNNTSTGTGSSFGSGSSGGLSGGSSSFGGGSSSFGGGSTPPVLGAGSQTNATPNQSGATGQLGSLATSGIGNGQTTGGGQIIGVASVSKGKSIKEFNDKDHYNDWLFVYDLRLEQSGGTGVTVASPMAANSAGTANSSATPGNANSSNPAGANGTQNPANGQPLPSGSPLNNGTPPQTPSPTPN
jgi:type II secretory pathway pseudopilin PulG